MVVLAKSTLAHRKYNFSCWIMAFVVHGEIFMDLRFYFYDAAVSTFRSKMKCSCGPNKTNQITFSNEIL